MNEHDEFFFLHEKIAIGYFLCDHVLTTSSREEVVFKLYFCLSEVNDMFPS